MHHMRVLRPAEGILAFYDGRVDGYRFADEENWVDAGALSLGIASYAVVGGDHAVVYDTHVTLEHARFVRDALEAEGVRSFTVVLSHWHLDHVAGTAVFEDCEIVASERTAELLARHRAAIERGELEGPPPIAPLVLPTRTFSGRMRLTAGPVELELIHVNIHSDDATVLWLPATRTLLCGDTMEDTITYVDEPAAMDAHLADLQRLRELAPARILPDHGHPDVIAAGGYADALIAATEQYLGVLARCRTEPALRDAPLRELIGEPLEAGAIHYFAPYEAVHRENVEMLLAASG
jgi:glyoxylase-like metal-dependent hydrolase (beta-lactamase superfamily II)